MRRAAPVRVVPRAVPHAVYRRPVYGQIIRRAAPVRVAPRFAPRVERRSSFVQYYSPARFAAPVRHEIVVRQYVAPRIFVPQPVRVVQQYVVTPPILMQPAMPVSYVYTGYAPATQYLYQVSSGLPIYWSPWQPATYSYPAQPYYSAPYASYDNYDDNDGDDGNGNGYYNGYGYGNGGGYNAYPVAYGGYPYGAPNPNPYGYANPWGFSNPFGNASLQGVVIGTTGSGVLVLTQSLKPVFVNTSVAQQNGYVNGSLQPGTFVNIYGYDTGSEFIATAIA